MGDGGQCGDVGDTEQRVRRRLAPHQPGLPGTYGGAHRRDVGQVDRGVLDAPARQHPSEQPVRATVSVGGDHDVVTRPAHRAQHYVGRGQTRREGQPGRARLDLGKAGLKSGAGRISRPGVLVAAPQSADPVLGEGRRQVDGHDDRPGRGVRLLAGVDRDGLEALLITGSGTRARAVGRRTVRTSADGWSSGGQEAE